MYVMIAKYLLDPRFCDPVLPGLFTQKKSESFQSEERSRANKIPVDFPARILSLEKCGDPFGPAD